jgi:hypothetical protein
MISYKITTLSLFLTLTIGLSYGQTEMDGGNSDEPKILKALTPLDYIDVNAKTLKIPKRKYDSPFFCDETILYKTGFIINSITSSRAGRQVDFTTHFFYYNETDKSLKKISISKADTIESIVSSGNTLYYSFIKNGKRQVGYFEENQSQSISNRASGDIRNHIDTSKWIKLGVENGRLFILSPNALFEYSKNEWKSLVNYSLDDFYINSLKYRRSMSMLPTKNLVVRDNSVYFLQEVVQDRTCNLFRLSMANGTLENYFTTLDYRDNYSKQVNDFTFLDDGSLLVTASRLIDNNMLINTKADKVNVWAFNNNITSTNGGKVEVPVTTALNSGDTLILASRKGLYEKYFDKIKPLVYFENSHQSIKEKGELIDFPFEPRSIIKLAHNNFIVGGMWGGLYQVDISNNKLTCLDDIDYDKIKTIDLSAI